MRLGVVLHALARLATVVLDVLDDGVEMLAPDRPRDARRWDQTHGSPGLQAWGVVTGAGPAGRASGSP